MKLLSLVLLIASSLAAPLAQACQPPRTNFVVQGLVLSKMFSGESAVTQKIEELAGTSGTLESMKVTNEGYLITLTNGCSFVANEQWDRGGSFPGACPRFKGLEIKSVICN